MSYTKTRQKMTNTIY